MSQVNLSKKLPFLLVLIVFVGFALRVWGINFGLPYQFHQDEPIVVNHALAYGTGDLNPHFFIIPPLCSYLLLVFYGFSFILGKIVGSFPDPYSFALYFFRDPSIFYIIARMLLGVIPGTLSIWLVYKVYARFFGIQGKLYAAMVVAFSFLPVINSHYAYADNLMVILILLCYLSFLRMVDHPLWKNYFISGILTGLAVNTKYNSAILAVSFMAAHIWGVCNTESKRIKIFFDRKLWIFALTAISVFLITNPFSVLDWKFFLSQTFGGIRHDYMGWTHHMTYSMVEGIGLWLVVFGLLGFIAIIKRGKPLKWLLFFSFPVMFYVHLVFASQPFSRYVLPLIPFFAMGASYFLFSVLCPVIRRRTHKILIIFLAAILLLPTALKSVKADILFLGSDTRAISKEWFENNIPPYSKVAADHTSLRPHILQTKEQMSQKTEITNAQKGLKAIKDRKIELEQKALAGGKTYNVYFLTYKDETRGQFLSTVPAINYDIGALREEGIDYVTINFNTMNPEKKDFLDILNKNADIIATFSPYSDNSIREPYDRLDHTFMAIGSRELFLRRSTGPSLVVYRIRTE